MEEQRRNFIKAKCESCDGTGLCGESMYENDLELQDGTAIICPICEGKGYNSISYIPFEDRRYKAKILKVFLMKDGLKKYPDKFSEYGCTYSEWIKGIKPKPIP